MLHFLRENKSIMTHVRLDDKRYNQNLFRSAFTTSERKKINIRFYIILLFFAISHVSVSRFTVYENRKALEF